MKDWIQQAWVRRGLVGMAVGLAYVILVVATLLTKLPWIDEAWVANPVWNWLENGQFTTSFFELANPGPLETFHEHTYWMPPVWFVCEAIWFKIWGVGIFQERALSAIFGGVTLIAVYYFTMRAAGSARCALWAVILLLVDFLFLNHAADGRMDMMVAACTFSSYALYLNLRKNSLPWAFLASNTAVAIGGLTNPIGIIGALGLLYLILLKDIKRITIKLLAVASIPYVIGGVLWGSYILANPDAFMHQFFGKTPAPDWSLPEALYREVVERYFQVYGVTKDLEVRSWSSAIIAAIYGAAGLCAIAGLLFSRDHTFRIVGGLLCVEFIGMAVLISIKSDYHMPQILPLYTTSLALLLDRLGTKGLICRGMAVSLGVAMLLLQLRISLTKIDNNPYARNFVPVVDIVRKAGPEATVFAPPEVAFALGFPDSVTYDIALGHYSGKHPDIVVLHGNQKNLKEIVSPVYPETKDHVERLLREEMELVLVSPSFRVLKRKDNGTR